MSGARIAILLVGACLSGIAAAILSAYCFRWPAQWQRKLTAAILGLLLSSLFTAFVITASK